MDVRHLRYFVVLSEELHFGRAAHRLHMAQPPLSQRIKELEREVGVELFHRRRSGVELSEAGALLLEHARDVLRSVERAEASMRTIRPAASGVLRAALPPDTQPDLLRDIDREFGSRGAGLRLSLDELTTTEQCELVLAGDLDVGVVRHPVPGTAFEIGPIVRRPLGALLPTNHGALTGEALALRDLAGTGLIIFPRTMAPALYDSMLESCRVNGFVPREIVHARNPLFTQGLVLAGKGVHFSEPPRGALPEGITWVPLAGEPLSWRTSALWRRGGSTPEIASFAAAVLAAFRAGGHRAVGDPTTDDPGGARV